MRATCSLNYLQVRYMHGLDPWIFSSEFAWFWYTRWDLQGGLDKLVRVYISISPPGAEHCMR